MKRWLRWAALAAVAAALSSGEIGMDIGKLRPVQVVRVSEVDGRRIRKTPALVIA